MALLLARAPTPNLPQSWPNLPASSFFQCTCPGLYSIQYSTLCKGSFPPFRNSCLDNSDLRVLSASLPSHGRASLANAPLFSSLHTVVPPRSMRLSSLPEVHPPSALQATLLPLSSEPALLFNALLSSPSLVHLSRFKPPLLLPSLTSAFPCVPLNQREDSMHWGREGGRGATLSGEGRLSHVLEARSRTHDLSSRRLGRLAYR